MCNHFIIHFTLERLAEIRFEWDWSLLKSIRIVSKSLMSFFLTMYMIKEQFYLLASFFPYNPTKYEDWVMKNSVRILKMAAVKSDFSGFLRSFIFKVWGWIEKSIMCRYSITHADMSQILSGMKLEPSFLYLCKIEIMITQFNVWWIVFYQ